MSDTAPDDDFSLLDHLSMTKPQLQAIPASKSRKNTSNPAWRRPSRITKWDDFNCDSLIKCCGGVFGEMLADSFQPINFHYLERDVIRFGDEAALEKHFLSAWTHPILKTALYEAQKRSSGRGIRSPFVEMVSGGNAQSISRYKPDWAGVRAVEQDDPKSTLNILPGDTKVSHKWKSSDIKEGDVNVDALLENWFWPVRQLFTYCMSYNTRYGYIISDEEVVAFRVRVPSDRLEEQEGSVSSERGTFEYVSVRESTQQSSGKRMTMNLALWWLHLLAANRRNIQDTYGALEDEVLDGLGRAPSPPKQVIPGAAVAKAGSPALSAATFNSVTEPDTIYNSPYSTFSIPSASFGGLSQSFTSVWSSNSARPKRKKRGEDVETSKQRTRKKRNIKAASSLKSR